MKFRNVWKNFIKVNIHKQNPETAIFFDKKNPKSHEKMPWNIYVEGGTKREFVLKFWFVHTLLKYKVVIPMFWLFNKLFGKKLITSVPDHPHNRVIKIFSEEWDEAILDWNVIMLGRCNNMANDYSDERWIKHSLTHSSSNSLKMIKNVFLTLVMMDNVYREFLNIFMFRTFQRMLHTFKNNKVYNHLIYAGDNIDNKGYKHIYEEISRKDREKPWDYNFRVDYFVGVPLIPKNEEVKEKVLKGQKEGTIPTVTLKRVSWRYDYVSGIDKKGKEIKK